MEIKFRVWVLKSKQLIQPCYAEIFKDGSFSGGYNYLNSTECILMQFTGLKDKNGKEIYFGDLMKQERSDIIYEVVWYKSAWAIKHKTKNAIWHQEFCNGVRLKFYEVIGNIHENPELIKDLQWK
jgi:uncharacterized phage protein (TIGR01671 family)